MKGVLEPQAAIGKTAENRKDELESELSVSSSYLQDLLNNEEVDSLNKYIWEKERIVELVLDPATINYKDCLLDHYRGVEDPYESEITDIVYGQNPNDPSQLMRNVVFKHDEPSDASPTQH